MNVRAASLRPDVLQLLLAALVSLIALTGCAATGTPSRPLPVFDGRVQEVEGVRFRIVDTGLYINPGIDWISERELLVNGVRYEAAPNTQDAGNHTRFLRLDVSSGKTLELGRRGLNVCTSSSGDGYVRFLIRDDPFRGPERLYEGHIDGVKLVATGDLVGKMRVEDGWAARDSWTCRARASGPRASPPPGWVIRDVLREGDGYLVSQEAKTAREFQTNLVGWWSGTGSVQSTGLQSASVFASRVTYAAFAQAARCQLS